MKVGLDTPWGPWALTVDGDAVLAAGPGEAPFAAHPAAEAFAAYLGGAFDALAQVEVRLIGTPFQQRVWAALRTIPAGQVVSYAALARDVGSVARAVGTACGANPCLIFVPCHRVVGADGSLTGYASGLDVKRALLRHEGRAALSGWSGT